MPLWRLFNRRSSSNNRRDWPTMGKTLEHLVTKTQDPSMPLVRSSSMRSHQRPPRNMALACNSNKGSRHDKDLSSHIQYNHNNNNNSSNIEINNRCSSNNNNNSSFSNSNFISNNNNNNNNMHNI